MPDRAGYATIYRMTDYAAALLAAGLLIAFLLGMLGAKFMRALRSMYSAQDLAKGAASGMRSARLRLVILAAIIFAIAWPWLHGYH